MLVWTAAGLFVAGVIWWVASNGGRDAAPAPEFVDPAPELARLRAEVDRQAKELALLRADLDRRIVGRDESRGVGEPAPMEAAAPQEQPSRTPDARRGARALEQLKAVTDGRRFVAVEDARTELVRIGDDAVPEVLALLDSGLETDWGGRFETRGFHVDSYPGLRMVLLDVLRQIGTPASKKAFVDALGRTEHVRDLWALKLYWGTTDPALIDGVSAVAPKLLRLVAKAGLPAAEADHPDSAVDNLLMWLYMHPADGIAGPLEEIVLQGRPEGTWSERAFESTFTLLARLAPEKAAEDALALQERDPAKRELVELSKRVWCPNAIRARFFATLFARGNFTPQVRVTLYEPMPIGLWTEKGWDHAAQVADALPYVDFLERRLEAETDVGAKRVLEESLSRLRGQIAADPK
jgi:hypothetical protein